MTSALVSSMDRFLRLIPTPLLMFITFVLTILVLGDVAVPDPIPFIDEALLLGLLSGAWMTLLERRRATKLEGGLEPSPERDPAVQGLNPGRVLKDLKAVSKELAAEARALRAGGHPVAALDALAGLPEEAKAQAAELKAADAFLSRRDHDPYKLDKELAGQQRSLAEAEAGGDAKAMKRAESALAATQARRAEVLAKRDRRDDLLLDMHRLATQAGALLEDLRSLEAERGGALLTEGLPALDPRFAAVVADLTEARTAAAEVEQTLSQNSARPVSVPPRGKERS